MASSCPHLQVFHGLCTSCGTLVKDKLQDFVSGSHHNLGLKLSRELGQKAAHDEASRLIKERRLALVLDLDHTLLHATCDPSLSSLADGSRHDIVSLEMEDLPPPSSSSSKPIIDRSHVVKMRPFLSQFLEESNKLFELHIFTHGNRPYANAIAKALDPKGTLFQSRIVSRDEIDQSDDSDAASSSHRVADHTHKQGAFFEVDDLEDSASRRPKMLRKTVSRIFPCNDSMVLILDDRTDVWNDAEHLIKIEPYLFFPGKDVNNAPGKSILSSSQPLSGAPPGEEHVDTVEELRSKVETDNQLLVVLDVLKSVHTKFFESIDKLVALQKKAITPSASMDVGEPKPEAKPAAPAHKRPTKRKKVEPSASSSVTPPAAAAAAPSLPAVPTPTHAPSSSQVPLPFNIAELLSHPEMPKAYRLLSEVKKTVLHGFHIVFTGVIPQGFIPQKHHVWQLAERFGATCHTQLDASTTHLIAVNPKTDKALQALKMPGVFVVNTSWLHASVQSWKRQPEHDYFMGKFYLPISAQFPPEVQNSIHKIHHSFQSLVDSMHSVSSQFGLMPLSSSSSSSPPLVALPAPPAPSVVTIAPPPVAPEPVQLPPAPSSAFNNKKRKTPISDEKDDVSSVSSSTPPSFPRSAESADDFNLSDLED